MLGLNKMQRKKEVKLLADLSTAGWDLSPDA
jgi:hypothetical protein